MLSEHYWPSIPKDALSYHPGIQTLLSTYLDTYAVLKKPRKLHPAMSLGQVSALYGFKLSWARSYWWTVKRQLHSATLFC